MDRVLVTGATGFTGSHLVRHLVAQGHDVRVIARSAQRARDVLPPSVEVIEGDIVDRDVIARAIAGREVVHHLAAAFREAGLPDRRYHDVHVTATRWLLEAAVAEGTVRRVVHCSTVGVHSHVANPPADETWPHTPGDIYQATKSEGEQVALAFHRSHGLPISVVRPTAIYGPGDMRLLKLFRGIARGRWVTLGKGEVYFHMVHVDDLVQALTLAARRPEAVGEAFIAGGDEYCTLNELTARIARIFGVDPPRLHVPATPFYWAGALMERVCVPLRLEPPLHRRRVAFFTKSRAFRIDKARRVLGYAPHVPLQRGLEETAAWYRDRGLV